MDWNRFPPLSSLRAFEAAARNLNFTAAGRELNVTHAAIAQQVRGLEAHIGIRLVERDGRGIRLTAEGSLLQLSLEDGFGRIGDALDALGTAEDERPLNVTMTPSFAVSWFMPRLERFRAAYPDIDLVINPTADTIDLAEGGCDVAIRYGSGGWKGLEVDLLVPSTFVIAAAPALVGKDWQGEPADLLKLPWLQEFGTHEVRDWMNRQDIAMPRHTHVTVLPGYMVLDALRRGQGIAATARALVADDLDAGRLVILHEESGELPVGYYLARRPGIQRTAVKHFTRWILREAKKAEGPDRLVL